MSWRRRIASDLRSSQQMTQRFVKRARSSHYRNIRTKREPRLDFKSCKKPIGLFVMWGPRIKNMPHSEKRLPVSRQVWNGTKRQVWNGTKGADARCGMAPKQGPPDARSLNQAARGAAGAARGAEARREPDSREANCARD